TRLCRADCHFREGHVGICGVGIEPIPTNVPTFGADIKGRPQTLLDSIFCNYMISVQFWM
ncbi:MAG TPA: hypothetical protein VIE66_16005, partial [Methylocella sp.]